MNIQTTTFKLKGLQNERVINISTILTTMSANKFVKIDYSFIDVYAYFSDFQ